MGKSIRVMPPQQVDRTPLATGVAIWHTPGVFHLGDVVRKLRLKAGWTVIELSKRAGVDKMTVSEIERGIGNQQRETLEKVAAALSQTVSSLYSMTEQAGSNAEPDVVDATNYKRRDIPVIAEGDAAPNGTFWVEDSTPRNQVDEWMSRPFDLRDQHAYAVILRGDSMEPMLKPGYRLIVSPNLSPADGELSYAQLVSGEHLVKVTRRVQGGWILESYNNAYPPRFVTDAEVASIHRVVYVRTVR
jgi:phage repressor protein C with HTH and peptisase S24 domain